MLMRAVVQRLRRDSDPRLIALIDGKPLPIGGSGHDPEARCGRGAGLWANGYKFYAIWAGRPVPETYRVYSMNINEDKVAEEMMPDLTGGGYILGDGEYDANGVFDAAGAAGYQMLAPREDPDAGLGHQYQSPYRRRCVELMRSAFGQTVWALRRRIEQTFGVLASFGGGLAPLPSWVRHLKRVWLWVSAKLVINGVRILALAKGFMAQMKFPGQPQEVGADPLPGRSSSTGGATEVSGVYGLLSPLRGLGDGKIKWTPVPGAQGSRGQTAGVRGHGVRPSFGVTGSDRVFSFFAIGEGRGQT